MDRLPEPLTTFRQIIEADLRTAARKIIRHQCELDPHWRFASPDGDYHLVTTLPADTRERQLMLRRVATLMAWKQVVGFTLASELIEPDSLYCLGVNHKEVHACASIIRRKPKPWTAENFGVVEWLPRTAIGQELIDLLPKGSRTITRDELVMLEKWFGAAGTFPLVHVASREVRGV